MSKVLVTGATGFVGSRLVQALVRRGEQVRILARPESSLQGLSELPQGSYELVRGDAQVTFDVYRALFGCDRMYHVAAVFKMWSRTPAEIMDGAVTSTHATLEAAARRGLSKIVVTSSVATIGASDSAQELDETHPFNLPQAETYVLAKTKAEQLALEYAAKGLPIVVVNPAAIFGPGDWKPTPSGQSILTYLCWKLPVGFPYSDGGLNVVDVDDVVEGHIAAMARGRIGERYILGGQNLSFEQMFKTLSDITGLRAPGFKAGRGMATMLGYYQEMLARITGQEPALTHKLARDFVGRYAWVSSAKALKELGYEGRPARQTLLRAVRWFLQHGYLEDRLMSRIRLGLQTA